MVGGGASETDRRGEHWTQVEIEAVRKISTERIHTRIHAYADTHEHVGMQTHARTLSEKEVNMKLMSQTKNNPNNNLKTINCQTNRS